MTPLEDCYTLSLSTILNEDKVNEIVALGHSRIPVHKDSNLNEFVGMLSKLRNSHLRGQWTIADPPPLSSCQECEYNA